MAINIKENILDTIIMILVFLIPVILCYLSLNLDTKSTLICYRDRTKDISYEINAIFKKKKIYRLDYIINYDITDLSLEDVEKIKQDEVYAWKEYSYNSDTDYFIIKESNQLKIDVYGYQNDVKLFFNNDYIVNYNFFKNYIENNSNYKCE